MNNTEIERRFKLDSIPDNIDILRFKMIEQRYLVTGMEEIRVRRTTDTKVTSYTLTIKRGKGLEREEENITINQNTYELLCKLSPHKPIEKVRYEVKVGGKLVEIDRFFHDTNLVVAEVEFQSVKEANSFVPPDWFGQEVTKKSQYNNQNLWKSINGIEETK